MFKFDLMPGDFKRVVKEMGLKINENENMVYVDFGKYFWVGVPKKDFHHPSLGIESNALVLGFQDEKNGVDEVLPTRMTIDLLHIIKTLGI